MRGNFDHCMDDYLKGYEGGYVNDPKDPGGETNFGISKRSYPRLDIGRLTWADAKVIYKKDFWDAVRGDELPLGVDLVVCDPAIHSGPGFAIKLLQKALGHGVYCHK